ncbi:MAG: carboxypeptidase-like regulatory domain-containing protein [Terracidiphilus sp.]
MADQTGAVVPGAPVLVDPSPTGPQSKFKTGGSGEIAFDFPVGSHIVSIALLGFETWTTRIEVTNASSQTVAAVLRRFSNFYVAFPIYSKVAFS